VKRGEVYLVNPQPAKGTELSKIRPAVIVSTEAINEQDSLTILVMLGSGAENFPQASPLTVKVDAKSGHLRKDTVFSALQLRALDRSRFFDPKSGETKYLSTLDAKTMLSIDRALLFALELHRYLPLPE
jgi:mRNA interferase MazF